MSSASYISSSFSRLNLAHRAAGASAQRGIRRAIEAASGRVARRCAARRRSRASASDGYAKSRRSLPGLKRIVLPGGMVTSTPVLGLRPMPRLRRFT